MIDCFKTDASGFLPLPLPLPVPYVSYSTAMHSISTSVFSGSVLTATHLPRHALATSHMQNHVSPIEGKIAEPG